MNLPDDELIVEQLRSILRDSVEAPDEVVTELRELFELRSDDDVVGELVSDSFEQLPCGVRRRAGLERDLTFAFETFDVVIRLDGPDLLGQVLGDVVTRVQLVSTDATVELDVADGIAFAAARPGDGAHRLVVTTADGSRLSTEWFRL